MQRPCASTLAETRTDTRKSRAPVVAESDAHGPHGGAAPRPRRVELDPVPVLLVRLQRVRALWGGTFGSTPFC